MKLVELYTLFLILYFGELTTVSTKCKYWEGNFVECKNLKTSDYPLLLMNSSRILTLSNTENLPNNAISGIHLEKLVIRYSLITNIAENAFSGLEDTLKVLHISTLAKQIPAPTQSLQNLYNLKKLEISHFKLNTTFNNMNFANLSRLQSLHLINNSLFFFENSVFKGLSALTNLMIKDNQFTTIPLLSVFADLTNLTILDMSDNKIVRITASNLQGSKNLEQLILEQNAIAEIEKNAFNGLEKSLRVLNLNLNKLNHTQLVNMADLISLQELNLQSNWIQALPNGIFKNFSHLQMLNLKSNKLSNIKKGSLFGLISLKTLQLDFNSLTVEAGTLLDTPQLQEIYFKKQTNSLQMEWLQDVSTSLLKLYLDENTFNKTSLWLAIQSLTKLKYLSLSRCNLGYIPNFAFEQNRQLQTLNLNENNLQVLRQETFQGLQESLISIKLELNELQTIDECVFKGFNWSILKEKFPIKLYQNNLVCNCSLLWLQKWIEIYIAQYPIQITNVNMWKCAGSTEYIYQANLTCSSNTTNQTCQDFSDRYTTTNIMFPTTTTYSTMFADATALSSTLTTTIKESKTETITTIVPTTTQTTTVVPTTTQTTTVVPTTTQTTTIVPTTTQTPEMPTLSLLWEKLSSSSISISWNISSWKHVQKFTLLINKAVEDAAVTKNKIVLSKKNSTSKILPNLKKGTILTVCIQVKLDFPSKLLDKCQIIRLTETEKVKSKNVGVYIGLGVGGAILITLVLIVISLMCYSRRVSKSLCNKQKSEADLNKPKTTLKTKRYQKRKTPNNPQVSIISAEPFQPLPRISAGSYQYLADPNLTSNSTQQPQKPPFYDNKAFTEINKVDEKIENNNNQSQSSTNRPLPNLPGSKSLIQYFQPEEPIYVNVQPHYAEIPHIETTI